MEFLTAIDESIAKYKLDNKKTGKKLIQEVDPQVCWYSTRQNLLDLTLKKKWVHVCSVESDNSKRIEY